MYRAFTYRILARLIVDANVGDMHRVSGRGDSWPTRRAQHVAHEGGEAALLLAAVRPPLLGCLAIIAVAVAWALGARWRGIHLLGQRVERGRLAEGGPQAGRLVYRLRVWWSGRTTCRLVRWGVESFLDNGVERGPDGGGGEVRDRRGRRLVRQTSVAGIRGAALLVDGRE